MKRILILCCAAALILTLCACTQSERNEKNSSPAAQTQTAANETTAPAPTPTASPSQTPETPETDPGTPTNAGTTDTGTTVQPVQHRGVLYENRKYYGGPLPTVEDRYYYTCLMQSREDDGHEKQTRTLTVLGQEYLFREHYHLAIPADDGSMTDAAILWGTGQPFMMGQQNSMRTDLEGRMISLSLVNPFWAVSYQPSDDEEAERWLISYSRTLIKDVFGVDLSTTPVYVQTLSESDLEHWVDGVRDFCADAQITCKLRFADSTGELTDDRGVEVTYHRGGMPLDTLSIELFAGLSEDTDRAAFADLTKDEVLDAMREQLPGILQSGYTVKDIFFDEDSLRFTTVFGRPAATVDAVVRMSNDTETVTGLCLVYQQQ